MKPKNSNLPLKEIHITDPIPESINLEITEKKKFKYEKMNIVFFQLAATSSVNVN